MTSPLPAQTPQPGEIQAGQRRASPQSLAACETLQLKNIRPQHVGLLQSSGKCAANCSAPKEPMWRPDCINSKKICMLMNDIYYSPLKYKTRFTLILEMLRKITSSEMANSVFFSVFQNLKCYVKEIRNTLRSKLNELELLESVGYGRDSPRKLCSRRYSADFITSGSLQETRLSWWSNASRNTELKPFQGSEENYVKFLTYLCEVYKNFCRTILYGPEEICHKLLSMCKSTTEIAECGVHKTVFYDYILEDCVISVSRLRNS
eukprot:TRINITY_DN12568_c0_g5_i2.p1 TRINITY_DN12568_c0_g5~~TRINITY_DN12568_c0_g5_i2.p1  ORF type:complete len:263 (+),score=32.66 TRINITY_DN12568_c0_g5_i2:314-1102(+)